MKIESTPRGLGWVKDRPDARDKHVGSLALAAAIPGTSSLRDHVIEVLDQSTTSECVAHAWAQALRVADMVAGVEAPPLPSRHFIYYNARAFDGGPIVDRGTELRSGARGLTKFGRPPEKAWPFDVRYIDQRPSWEAYREGYDWKGPAGYYRVTTLAELRQAIAAGKPVVGGVYVGNSIFGYESGIYDPDPKEPIVGGHALCFTGYGTGYYEIVGSWGIGYGEAGFMRVSERFASKFSDLWAVHL